MNLVRIVSLVLVILGLMAGLSQMSASASAAQTQSQVRACKKIHKAFNAAYKKYAKAYNAAEQAARDYAYWKQKLDDAPNGGLFVNQYMSSKNAAFEEYQEQVALVKKYSPKVRSYNQRWVKRRCGRSLLA